jgi:hypothetical protein
MKQPTCNLGQIVFTLWAVLICLPASVQAQYTIQAGDRVALEWNYNTSNGASNARDINNCNVVGERRPGQEGIARSSRTCVSLSGWNIEGWYFVNNSPQYGTTWTAERLSDGYRLLYPMPGIGAWPNVSTGNRSWRVRIFNDISVPVCSSPGGSIQGYKYLGSMGWTLPDQPVSTSSAVWWRVRWDDGTIGWSPDSVAASAYGNRPGVYFAWYNRETRNFQQGCLSVSPSDGLTSSGPQGGPFSPSSKNYTLTNTGELNLNWSVSVNCNWVSVSQSSGSLSPGQYTTVTVSLNSNANSLPPGTHTCTVSFINTTNNCGSATREVRLTVRGDTTPPSLSNCRVSPSSICAGRTTTISANVTDSESGVAAVWADVCGTRVDMSPAGGSTYQGTYQAPCSTSDRSCNVIIYARDQANNQASCNAGTLSISGDRNPPTGSTCINPTSVGANGGTINLYANLEDACCGVDRAFARIYKNGSFEATVNLNAASGSTPCAHNYRGTYAIPANNTGSNINWEIEICGQDRAGYVACSNRYRLVQPPCIQVTPSGGANFHRSSNGTVNPPSFPYTITNAGTSEIQYRVSTNQNWLNISPTNGTLPGGRSVRIDLSVNNNARNLSPGTYTATVTFRNTTTGCEENRTVTLTVEGRNNTGTGQTSNPYWGARVRVYVNCCQNPIEGNLVAYYNQKVYLHKVVIPRGCNCPYGESITVTPDGRVIADDRMAIPISNIQQIVVVDPRGYNDLGGDNGYGGINKYIIKYTINNQDVVKVVELGSESGCGTWHRRSFNALAYGTAYANGVWSFFRGTVNNSSRNVNELIAIPLASIDVTSDTDADTTRALLIQAASRYKIPPHILFAIAAQENQWLQAGYEYRRDGPCDGSVVPWCVAKLSQLTYDGGIGLMQITGVTAFGEAYPQNGNDLVSRLTHIYKLAQFKDYNIQAGAKVLYAKSRYDCNANSCTPQIGPGLREVSGRRVLEHWYYAVGRYRGELSQADLCITCGRRAPEYDCSRVACVINSTSYPKLTYAEAVWSAIRGGSNCQMRPACENYPEVSAPWDGVDVTDAPPGELRNWSSTDNINITCFRFPSAIPTPLPAHVDVDFDGVIDFKIHGPGSLEPGRALCSAQPSSDPYGRLSLVCSQEQNSVQICGWVERLNSRDLPTQVEVKVRNYDRDVSVSEGIYRCPDNPNKGIFRVSMGLTPGDKTAIILFRSADGDFCIHHAFNVRGSRLMTRAIRGRLELQNYEGEMPHIVTFVLRDPSTGEIVAEHDTYLDAEGNFDVPAPVGQLELSVKVSHWLRRAVLVDTTLGDVEGLVLSLINGDANDDNVVDGEDLAMVVQNYGFSCWDDCPEGGLPGDLNGDLVVDDNDLLIVLFNFGQQGD